MGKIQANIGGVIRDMKKAQSNIGGVIRDIKKIQSNIGGVIKDIWQSVGEKVWYYRGYEGCPITFSITGQAGFANYTKLSDHIYLYGTASDTGLSGTQRGYVNSKFRVDLTNISTLIANCASSHDSSQIIYFQIYSTTGVLLKSFQINMGSSGYYFSANESSYDVSDVSGVVDITFTALGYYNMSGEDEYVTIFNEYRRVYSLVGFSPADIINQVPYHSMGVGVYNTGLIDMAGLMTMTFSISGEGKYSVIKDDGTILYTASFDTLDKNGEYYQVSNRTLTRTQLSNVSTLGSCKFEITSTAYTTTLQNLKLYATTLP